MYKPLTLLLGSLLLSSSIMAQEIYVAGYNQNLIPELEFGLFDPSTCTYHKLSNLEKGSAVDDIAYCPDEKFYIEYSFKGKLYIARVNVYNGNVDTLIPLKPGSGANSLVCRSDTLLIGANGDGKYHIYDINKKDYYYVGLNSIAGTSGDLTFYEGKMYACYDLSFGVRRLTEVDIHDLSNSKVFSKIPMGIGGSWCYGMSSLVYTCDSTVVYVFLNYGSLFQKTDVYILDMANQQGSYLCTIQGLTVQGATTTTEFYASDCSIKIDLDKDNSSGAVGKDYKTASLCGQNTSLYLGDDDLAFHSGYRVDSVVARFQGGVPDAPFEYMSAQASSTVGVSTVSNGGVKMYYKGGTFSLGKANAGYRAALHTLRWHNTAAVPTPGQRIIEVIAYASNGLTDTAYTYLSVEASAQAGRDTLVVVCADAAPVSLATLLGANASAGGVWVPAPSGGSGIFVPQVDAPGVYQYIVGGTPGCPPDTARVLLQLQPLPVFSLGNDTSVCAGKGLTLKAPATARWHDGSLAPAYTATQSGLYWAELNDPHGCRWRDSIRVQVLPAPTFQQTASACQGSTYVWNGLHLSSDTALCLTLKTANGCDSIDCLKLSFQTPALALDTTLCSGKALAWHGRLYDAPGLYQDTAWLNGCLTVLRLRLQMLPPDTVHLLATLCPGETYTLGGQTFSTPGKYFVSLPGQHLRCDTVVALRLEGRTPPSYQREATLCPGATYAFGQRLLHAPGIYRDTFGCDSIVVLTLSQHPAPTLSISGQRRLCAGQRATLSAEGPYVNWRWSTGAQTPTIQVGGGTYRLTIADAFGCTATDSVRIEEALPLQAQWTLSAPKCLDLLGGTLEITSTTGGFGGYQYDIGLGQWSSTGWFGGLYAGTYLLQIRDSAGCTATYEITLPPAQTISLDLGPTVTLEPGQPYAIPVSIQPSGVYFYAWSPTSGLSCANCPNPVARPQETTTYWLRIENAQGCWAEDSVLLRVRAAEVTVYAPNVFSPNGDSHNDYFTLFASTDRVAVIEVLQIFDRWGNLVFEGQHLPIGREQAGWDGSWRGRELPPAVYTWHARLRLSNGTQQQLAGSVTLVR
jgi:gliding motility-associated-like protein